MEVVESFGQFPAEYAAVRRHVGIMHMPQLGRVELIGADRTDFLHRMLTNDVNSLKPGEGRRAFLLNVKGRIEADIIILQDESRTLLCVDVFSAQPMAKTLDAMLFTEDVGIADQSEQFEHLALHGPAAITLINQVAGDDLSGIEPLQHRAIHLLGQEVVIYRHDDAGSLALHLLMPKSAAGDVYKQLLDAAGFDAQAPIDADYADQRRKTLRGRPIGWLAYNTARIEAGNPIYHIDFGPDSLPGETGIIDQAVSFTKGCYLGQEIVARMKNLGHPKRVLVGLKFADDQLPVAGAPVHLPAQEDEAPSSGQMVGGVTSSTLSPVLGQNAIGFAVMKWGCHGEGKQVVVPAETGMTKAVVHRLGFIPARD